MTYFAPLGRRNAFDFATDVPIRIRFQSILVSIFEMSNPQIGLSINASWHIAKLVERRQRCIL
jgi:hypothetical protein